MVMRGVIYMAAGSSLFSWEPVCLPKFVFPLNWRTVYEKERGVCTHHLNVGDFVCFLFVFVSPALPLVEDE